MEPVFHVWGVSNSYTECFRDSVGDEICIFLKRILQNPNSLVDMFLSDEYVNMESFILHAQFRLNRSVTISHLLEFLPCRMSKKECGNDSILSSALLSPLEK